MVEVILGVYNSPAVLGLLQGKCYTTAVLGEVIQGKWNSPAVLHGKYNSSAVLR